MGRWFIDWLFPKPKPTTPPVAPEDEPVIGEILKLGEAAAGDE
jgi:hypothetical protein